MTQMLLGSNASFLLEVTILFSLYLNVLKKLCSKHSFYNPRTVVLKGDFSLVISLMNSSEKSTKSVPFDSLAL